MNKTLNKKIASHRDSTAQICQWPPVWLASPPKPWDSERAKRVYREMLHRVADAYPKDSGLARRDQPWKDLDAAILQAQQQQDMAAYLEAVDAFENTAMELFRSYRRSSEGTRVEASQQEVAKAIREVQTTAEPDT